jgi:hypothetical protein
VQATSKLGRVKKALNLVTRAKHMKEAYGGMNKAQKLKTLATAGANFSQGASQPIAESQRIGTAGDANMLGRTALSGLINTATAGTVTPYLSIKPAASLAAAAEGKIIPASILPKGATMAFRQLGGGKVPFAKTLSVPRSGVDVLGALGERLALNAPRSYANAAGAYIGDTRNELFSGDVVPPPEVMMLPAIMAGLPRKWMRSQILPKEGANVPSRFKPGSFLYDDSMPWQDVVELPNYRRPSAQPFNGARRIVSVEEIPR